MKTVIVTGASGAIGSACCRRFLKEGYNVTACYLSNETGAKELASYATRSEIMCVKADISDSHDIKKIFDITIEKFGSVDIVVNNAAISVQGLIQDITPEELSGVININIRGTFLMCSNAIGHMVKSQSGSIVNISSMWGETGASCEVAYSMSKAAVIGLTKALAKEVGPSGIRVNCVSPGLIDTKMNSCYTKEELDAICEETPLMRMGTPEDIANAVYYLSSGESSFITGQIIGVNGGYVI